MAAWGAALAAPAMAQLPSSARLATLDIAVWPEYDRAAVLVIYRGRVAEDVPLPAQVSILIPPTMLDGRPNTLVGQDPNGDLSHISYTISEQEEGWLISFASAYRIFQLEFYDALDRAGQNAPIVWPGRATRRWTRSSCRYKSRLAPNLFG